MLNDIKEQVEEITEQFKDRVEEISDQIKDGVGSAVTNTKKTGRQVNIYVKKNPWTTSAIALAAGFAAGWILKWRRNSK